MSDRERETGEREGESDVDESGEPDAEGWNEPDVEAHGFKLLEPEA